MTNYQIRSSIEGSNVRMVENADSETLARYIATARINEGRTVEIEPPIPMPETRHYERSHMTLEYRLPSGGRVARGTNREIVASQVAHERRYAHATDFRVRETTTVETVTTSDVTAEVLS